MDVKAYHVSDPASLNLSRIIEIAGIIRLSAYNASLHHNMLKRKVDIADPDWFNQAWTPY